jgi:hypothetical protein
VRQKLELTFVRSNLILAGGFIALLALTAWLLWPGVYGPFLFDDFPNLQNLAELNGKLTLRALGYYLSLFNGVPGRPLSALSFVLNDSSWPSEPFGFKVTNLCVHLLNGVLVFGLARSLARCSKRSSDAQSDLIALGCATIWLLNPIQVSAVFLTVQRMAELAATVMFAGLWGFVALSHRARSWYQAVFALGWLGAATVFAVLCKENGALLPLLALVLHTTVLRSSLEQRPRTVRLWLRGGVWAAVLFLVAGLVWNWSALTSFSSRDYTMSERLMTQARALVQYANLIVIPRLSSSALYNDDFQISRALLQPGTTLPALLIVAGALVVAVAVRKRLPLLAFAVLWFLAAHAMESSVFPLEMYFEHRNYVPLFGPAFAIAAGVILMQGGLRRPLLAAFAVWMLLLAAISHLQATIWGDERLLATVWHLEHPRSLRAQQQYAIYLYDNGRRKEAHDALTRAAAAGISPVDTKLEALLVECQSHRMIPREEIEGIAALLRTRPLAPGTAVMLGRLRESVQSDQCPQGFGTDAWEALADQALANPAGSGIWRMLIMERAHLYLASNRLDDAIRQLDLAYEGHGEPRIAFYAAALLATAGRYDEARVWAARPLGRPWNWKDWLAQTDRQAHELIDAIDESKAAAARKPTRPK